MDDAAFDDRVRPRDLALLILASGELLPRQRARTQQADLAGLDLKRDLLERIVELDPDPVALEESLARIVQDLSPPPGPARALALVFREEWQAACASPEWMSQLLADAITARRHQRKDQPGG